MRITTNHADEGRRLTAVHLHDPTRVKVRKYPPPEGVHPYLSLSFQEGSDDGEVVAYLSPAVAASLMNQLAANLQEAPGQEPG